MTMIPAPRRLQTTKEQRERLLNWVNAVRHEFSTSPGRIESDTAYATVQVLVADAGALEEALEALRAARETWDMPADTKRHKEARAKAWALMDKALGQDKE